MRIRIEKIYDSFYLRGFDKYEVIVRCYVNGQYRFKRLFFNTKEEAGAVAEGMWIDY